ncbi:MAG: choice-of-anchor D domain-containing protein, partial [Acidobacteria bacterium]
RLTQHITRRQLLVDCRGALTVSPASLNFGEVRALTSKDLTVSVRNTGNAKLLITVMTSDSPQFAAASPAVPFDVSPGTERDVTVRFSPASVATYSGNLTISGTSGGTVMSAVVSLAGTGLLAANPSPTLTGISPASAAAGAAGFNLVLTGTNFMEASQVLWDGSPRPTTFVSPTQLHASIGTGDVASDDIILVRVMNPAPGGGLSAVQYFTVNPQSTVSSERLYLRGLAPTQGPAGAQVTIVGSGFSATAANNVVNFYRKGTTRAARIQSASGSILVCQVPDGLELANWAVSVTVAGQETRGVGFEVTAATPSLSIFPTMAFLLMPPGSGKELLVLGGGKPPYKLKPLKAEHQALARAELNGSVVEVTGLSTGQYNAADLTIEVEDSAATPAKTSATVRVQTPLFDPSFDASFPSLLAGSSPSFGLMLSDSYGQMRLAKVVFKFQNATIEGAVLKPQTTVAFGDVDNGFDYNTVTISAVDSPTKARFAVNRLDEGLLVQVAAGTLEPGAITNQMDPPPREESVVPGGTQTWMYFRPDVVRLPASPGSSFTITAVMTSVTTCAGKNLPLTKVLSKSFTTTAPPPGSPTISTIRGDVGATGSLIWLEGAGFAATPAQHRITFEGPGGSRVDAPVRNVIGNHLSCLVPLDAVSGPVRLEVGGKVSNDYEFKVRFHPDVFISFPTFPAGGAASPQIVLAQEQWELRIGSVKLTSDQGAFTAAALAKDQPAGTVSEYSAYGTMSSWPFYYRGQETDGARRHVFDYSGGSVQIHASANSSGHGVTFEVSKTGGFDLNGSTLILAFDKAIMAVPGAKGTAVTFDVEVKSVQWMFDAGNLMTVRFQSTRTTE